MADEFLGHLWVQVIGAMHIVKEWARCHRCRRS